MKLFLVGFLLLITESLVKAYGPKAWLTGALSLAFIGLSLDELAGFHEQAGFVIDRTFLRRRFSNWSDRRMGSKTPPGRVAWLVVHELRMTRSDTVS